MYSTLSIGEKIRYVRELKGLSLENISNAINKNISTISRFERGELEFSAETLAQIKEILEIEKAPLFEHELKLYRGRMDVWNELSSTNRLVEAEAMREEMSVILELPFEHDLYLLYLMIEAELLGRESNFSTLEKNLIAAESLLDNASNEALIIYYRHKGTLCSVAGDCKNGLKYSLKSLSYTDDEREQAPSTLFNISKSYIALGKPNKAIKYLELTKMNYKGNITESGRGRIALMLGICYWTMHEYSEAAKAFETALTHARSLNDEYSIGIILCNMSRLKLGVGEYEESIRLCDQALVYQQQQGHRDAYVFTLINKLYSLLAMKEYDKCRDVLKHGKTVLQEGEPDRLGPSVNGDDLAHILEAIGHLMSLDNNDSVNYIQNIAIPHLRIGGMAKFEALILCNHLEAHFTKKRAKTKANAIAAISRDIYREIYEGEIEFE